MRTLEEENDDGNEEEITDNQQRVLSEALEELGVDCNDLEDTTQENNVSLYVLPVEESTGRLLTTSQNSTNLQKLTILGHSLSLILRVIVQ